MRNTARCVFEYLYRDGDNFKAHGKLLVVGQFREELREELVSFLTDGTYFVPQSVDVPPLQPSLYVLSGGATIADHSWHEFVNLRPATTTEARELIPDRTLTTLLAQFRACKT